MARAPKTSPPPDEGVPQPAERELVRLNKYLADCGIASRRKCDELIAQGKVSVDGETVTELGVRVDPEQQAVEIDGYVLKPLARRRRYYLLNKPAGVVCTNEARETRPRAIDLITDPRKGRIYTIGRLDEDSTGLILLTNDGDFAHRVMHPRHGVEKTYVVKVRGKIDDDALNQIRDGIHLSEGRTAGARILVERRKADSSILSITLREGMNREIRRVFARFGYKVVDLKRVRIGGLTHRGIKVGRWRELAPDEVRAVLEDCDPDGATRREHGGRPRRGEREQRPRGDHGGERGLRREHGRGDFREGRKPERSAPRGGRNAPRGERGARRGPGRVERPQDDRPRGALRSGRPGDRRTKTGARRPPHEPRGRSNRT